MNVCEMTIQLGGMVGCPFEPLGHIAQLRVMSLLRGSVERDWRMGKNLLRVFPNTLKDFMAMGRPANRRRGFIEDSLGDAAGVAVNFCKILAQRLGGGFGLLARAYRVVKQLVVSLISLPVDVTWHVCPLPLQRAATGGCEPPVVANHLTDSQARRVSAGESRFLARHRSCTFEAPTETSARL